MVPYRLSDAEIDSFLSEDVPFGDLTTRSLRIGAEPGRMIFRARAGMVVSSTEEAARLLERAGASVSAFRPSGSDLAAGEILLEASGPASALLAGWKVAQTLVESASGIASAAKAIVTAARAVAPGISIACTRKTFPGTKSVALKAIMAGGAVAHRLGLSESILLFPEHRAFRPGHSLGDLIAQLRQTCPERKVVVEVNSLTEAVEAARAKADVVQLEKFTPAALSQVVAEIGGLCVVAAAGGINAGNAAQYAANGAHVLVTSSPYWAPPSDVAVSITGE